MFEFVFSISVILIMTKSVFETSNKYGGWGEGNKTLLGLKYVELLWQGLHSRRNQRSCAFWTEKTNNVQYF